MSVGPLFTVFGLLTSRAATVGTSDILLLLGFGLHLATLLGLITAPSEIDTVFEDILKIIHSCLVYGLQFTVYS